jgi:glutathione-regulated potassium-efflux system ancillary protein KefC
MDPLWLIAALAFGLTLKLIGLPPLIGFLAAGFGLNLAGMEPNATLDGLAHLGVVLLLFTIGLKLKVGDLVRREVWATTMGHMGAWVLVVGALVLVTITAAAGAAGGLQWRVAETIALALSFSSTVCAIKVLEDSGELATRHGRLCVGILVMQDIVAVVFLVLATGKMPSPWAALLLGLYWVRPLLRQLVSHAGHGELLPLTGLVLAVGGYELFSAVGIKGDLGALVAGVMLSGHGKASELSKSLLHFKDLFLIGFFLSIGLTTLPTWQMFYIAFGLCLLLPLKMALFFLLLTRLRLRARTAYLTALAMGNYSEFGLIVIALCVSLGWLAEDALVIVALTVSISFVITSVVYRSAHGLYSRVRDVLKRYEHPERLPEDVVYRPREAEILVVGVGRVGRGAFRALHRLVGNRVWGMDANSDLIRRLHDEGMNVFLADGESADVWEAIDPQRIRLVILAVPQVDDCRNIAKQLRLAAYAGPIAAIARYDDQRPALLDAGVDHVLNFFHEAGVGLAEDSLRLLGEGPPSGAFTAG